MGHLARQHALLFELLALEVGPVGVVALVIGHDGATIDLCICTDDDAVEERSRLLLDLYAGDARSVLFATVRVGPPVARYGEAARFRRLQEHGHRVGLPVLDWFVVGDGGAAHSLSGANVPPERQ